MCNNSDTASALCKSVNHPEQLPLSKETNQVICKDAINSIIERKNLLVCYSSRNMSLTTVKSEHIIPEGQFHLQVYYMYLLGPQIFCCPTSISPTFMHELAPNYSNLCAPCHEPKSSINILHKISPSLWIKAVH